MGAWVVRQPFPIPVTIDLQVQVQIVDRGEPDAKTTQPACRVGDIVAGGAITGA